MKNRPPITLQSNFRKCSIRSAKHLSALSAAAVLVIACGTTDPTTSPRLSPAEPETASQSPFSPVETGDNFIPTTTPAPDQEQRADMNGEPLGTVLPELPPEETTAGASDTQTSDVPVVSSASCAASETDMQQRMLQLINEARATERQCGDDLFFATRPLLWNTSLADAARAHSMDMAVHNFFSHTGSDGSDASSRVTGAGYRWRTVGENIAAGRNTAAETINDWLESPGHCRNIMNPSFTEVAVTCAEEDSSDFRQYWTNVLAAPR